MRRPSYLRSSTGAKEDVQGRWNRSEAQGGSNCLQQIARQAKKLRKSRHLGGTNNSRFTSCSTTDVCGPCTTSYGAWSYDQINGSYPRRPEPNDRRIGSGETIINPERCNYKRRQPKETSLSGFFGVKGYVVVVVSHSRMRTSQNKASPGHQSEASKHRSKVR